MMQLRCPWCGDRPEHEFQCGGTSHIQRPALDCSDEDWGRYMFFRENPRGDHPERWRHTYGCGQWFNVVRDTLTHDIHAVYGMLEAPPQRPGAAHVAPHGDSAPGGAGKGGHSGQAAL
jgi:sarcosine oxidase subunit delta